MPFPDPEPGLVIRYDFLWTREADKGRQSSKDRPACLVASIDDETAPHVVLILPITHSQPRGETAGIEIPHDVMQTLGLDDERSWVVLSEANVDYWPNAGVRPIPGKGGAFSYGFLPPVLFRRVKSEFMNLLARRLAKLVHR